MPHTTAQEFVDLGRASGIGTLCCFRCARFEELDLVPCYWNRKPWSRMGSNIYYFGGTGGGVFKTIDGGIHWEPITDGQISL